MLLFQLSEAINFISKTHRK